MEISNLPMDLAEEILSKVPITYVRAIRLTCKSWNSLSKTQSFAEKHISQSAKSKSRLFITLFSDMSLMSLDLHGIQDNTDPSVKRQRQFTRYDISQIVHCDGLLLSIIRDNEGLVVWNPYWGEKRWVEPRTSYGRSDIYAIGYGEKRNKSRSHKILRFMCDYAHEPDLHELTYEVYDFKSNSWRCFGMTRPDWMIETFYQFGVSYHMGSSLKGNTYWVTQPRTIGDVEERFLISFDFTRERFGQCLLRFPFQSYVDVDDGWLSIALSSVREEQLVVLLQRRGEHEVILRMEIWITSKITPETVLWSKLWLGVDMLTPFSYRAFSFPTTRESFIIDEEKKVFVFIDESQCGNRIEAFIIGVGGCLERVDLGSDSWSGNHNRPIMRSYVPSGVHIMKQAEGGKRKHCVTKQNDYYESGKWTVKRKRLMNSTV